MSSSDYNIHYNRYKDYAICKFCDAKLSTKGSSTSGLKRHYLAKHEATVLKRQRSEESGSNEIQHLTKKPKLVQKSIGEVSKKVTLHDHVAKLAAKDLFSIHAISKSEALREFICLKGFSLPKNPNHIMDLINRRCQEVKAIHQHQINTAKKNGSKFAVDIDEYTSAAQRKYLNTNLWVDDKLIHLGLKRMAGSHNAEACLELLKEVLSEYDLSESDMISQTTDGASVMVKMGYSSPWEYQLCLTHGLHLSVIDALYKQYNDDGYGNNNEDDRSEIDSDSEEFGDLDEQPQNDGFYIYDEVAESIQKVTKITKVFKNATVKRDTLRKYTLEAHN